MKIYFHCVYSKNCTSESFNKPLLSFFLVDPLESTENSSSGLSPLHSLASSSKDYIEVHTIDTCGGIILNTKIDMFFNTEPKVSYIKRIMS